MVIICIPLFLYLSLDSLSVSSRSLVVTSDEPFRLPTSHLASSPTVPLQIYPVKFHKPLSRRKVNSHVCDKFELLYEYSLDLEEEHCKGTFQSPLLGTFTLPQSPTVFRHLASANHIRQLTPIDRGTAFIMRDTLVPTL